MARLKEEYDKRIKKELKEELGYSNIMEVPTLSKIVINVGAGAALKEAEAMDEIINLVTQISGQKPVVNKAKKSVSSFKVR